MTKVVLILLLALASCQAAWSASSELWGFIGFDEQIARVSPVDSNILEKLSRMGAVVDHTKGLPDFIDIYAPEHIVEELRQEAVSFEILDTTEREATRALHRQVELELADSAATTRSTTPFSYHNYLQLTEFLQRIHDQCPDITKLYSVGQSVRGRQLWVIDFSDNPDEDEPDEPEFKYIGNMHGDETVGRECLVQLILQLCTQYGTNDRITRLVNGAHLSIMPSMNPDGFEAATRANARGIDLNRNFPDQFTTPDPTPQPEVQAVMAWSLSRNYMLSANLHGGDLVANYPFDGNVQHVSGQYAASPDDQNFIHMALTYSYAHTTMHNSRSFANGITNGANWYVLYGGMQDWNYLHTNDMELTLELSVTKYPLASNLATYIAQNKEALVAYAELIFNGARGTVVDQDGQPVVGASVSVAGIDHVLKTDRHGQFYRYLIPGTYSVTVSHLEANVTEENVVVPVTGAVVLSIALNLSIQ